jgi:hypothetical protein
MRPLIAFACVAALVGCGSSSIDQRQMARDLARDSIECVVDTDCCAIVDECKAQVLLVSSTDRSAVEVLLGEASQDSCARCVVPPVQVDCQDGHCVAAKLVNDGTATTSPELATRNHCGLVTLPSGWSVPASAGAGGGLGPETILGCD